jgi:hypothetical protein
MNYQVSVFIFSTLCLAASRSWSPVHTDDSSVVPGRTDERTLQGTGLISMFEVEKHNKREDCWIVLEGQVWDMTGVSPPGENMSMVLTVSVSHSRSQFLQAHPGGTASILRMAGKDATRIFAGLHPPGTLDPFMPTTADAISSTNEKPKDGTSEDSGLEGVPVLIGLLDQATIKDLPLPTSEEQKTDKSSDSIPLQQIIGLPDFAVGFFWASYTAKSFSEPDIASLLACSRKEVVGQSLVILFSRCYRRTK